MSAKKTQSASASRERPPIVVIMGHIDHGKSTLLDYIRKTNVVATEAGGITQHLSAYEVTHPAGDGTPKRITFLDTPGHEAFSQMRSRGARVADVAILVVSAEDGVKAQTKEALASIVAAKTPYIVAINKIDKPAANIERTKNSLVENEIYIEGYGGDIPAVPISAKTGQGVPELLDMVLLVADLQSLTADASRAASGVVIEANVDPKKGTSATLIVKNGTLKKGMFLVAERSITPVRAIETHTGALVAEASFSSPVRITGWNTVPPVGATFDACESKKEAEQLATEFSSGARTRALAPEDTVGKVLVPIIIKTDVSGTLEAVEKEIGKLDQEKIGVKIVHAGVGTITEGDVKSAQGTEQAIILGFNVKMDAQARTMAERTGTTIQTFDIIYKLTEWLGEEIARRTPKETVLEVRGRAQILRLFSATKHKQVLGGRVTEGVLESGATVRIMRRDTEIGTGKVIELQQQKVKADKVAEGNEFGAMVESRLELTTGDILEALARVER